jgi:hypothetical protein
MAGSVNLPEVIAVSAMVWMMVPPSKFMLKINSQCDILRSLAFGRWLNLEDFARRSGISPVFRGLEIEGSAFFCCLSSYHLGTQLCPTGGTVVPCERLEVLWRTQQQGTIVEAERAPLTRPELAMPWDLASPAFRTMRTTFLLLEATQPVVFVVAVQTH